MDEDRENTGFYSEPIVRVKHVEGVFTWSWNVKQDVCAICRRELDQPCGYCVVASTGAGDAPGTCSMAVGACQHVFHYHCIFQWLKVRRVCPIDNGEWETRQLDTRVAGQ